MSIEAPVEHLMPPEEIWFTLPGVVVDGESFDPVATLEFVRNDKVQTAFMKRDVFNFHGCEDFTLVITNRLNPVWHFLDIGMSQFRKEFFS